MQALKISVLTPSYNSGLYIERAIESVRSQNYPNYEHIIVDGGSTDNTISILKKYPDLKWISEPDKGQSDAMNKAFSMSNGDLIIYLNADDSIESSAFKFVSDYFSSHPSCELLVGDLKYVYGNDVNISRPSTSLGEILNYWPCRFPLNPVSYYYRKHVQDSIGPFPVDNHFSMDYWFLLRAYRKFNVQKTDRVLGTFFIHPECKSYDSNNAKIVLKTEVERFKKEFPFTAYWYILSSWGIKKCKIFYGKMRKWIVKKI